MTSFFDEIAGNSLKAIILMALFVLLFSSVIYIFVMLLGGGFYGFVICFVLVILYAIAMYYTGDKVVLAVSGAKEANPKEYSALCATVEGLAAATQIKQPRVYVINDPNPNAFATGRRSNPSVAVTTGLLAALSKQELEGVIAHEISHISDNDILVMTMAIAFAGAIGLIAVYIRSIFWYGSAFRGGDRRDNNGSGTVIMIAALLVSVLAPLCALLIRLAISRKREYMADANGARIIRNPAALANALKKIGSYTSRPNVPGVTKANEVTAPMYFSNPLKVGSITSNLFSTHPPIEDRIAKLEHMY